MIFSYGKDLVVRTFWKTLFYMYPYKGIVSKKRRRSRWRGRIEGVMPTIINNQYNNLIKEYNHNQCIFFNPMHFKERKVDFIIIYLWEKSFFLLARPLSGGGVGGLKSRPIRIFSKRDGTKILVVPFKEGGG